MAVYVGTNYHPHDWTKERWKVDIDFMKKAGLTIVRLGHLCWDSYEPEEGVYTFEWFDEVMNLFAEAGIGVVLDISMRPAPIWVHKLCPGCNISGRNGVAQASIHRYMEDVDDPAYQYYALRFAGVLVNRYKEHPALHAFGLCNEEGSGMMSFSGYARERFINWLKKKYETVEKLNACWATQRWSRRLSSFEDVVLPENEFFKGAPEAWLDMRRFFSDGIIRFMTRLAGVVRENAPGIPFSTNLFAHSGRLGFDYLKDCEAFMDYPGMGYYPMYDMEGRLPFYFMAVYRECMSEMGKPVWFLEFQTGRDGIFCGPKGYLRMQMMLGLMNRGEMFLGWTWRSMYGGEEQYHHGILGHDGMPTPNYYELAQVSEDMKKLAGHGFPYLPVPDTAVAHSMDSWWMTKYQDGQFRQDYQDVLVEVQKAFFNLGREHNVVNLRNLKNDYKLIIVPNYIVMDRVSADTLRKYVEQGGTVIMTGYSGTVNENGQVFQTPRPGLLTDVFGIRVAGFYRTDMPGFFSENSAKCKNASGVRELLSVSGQGRNFYVNVDYYEDIELHTAQSFTEFTDKKMCAVSVNNYGKGKAYYIAAETNCEFLQWLIEVLTDELGLKRGLALPEGVQGRRIAENKYFYVNTSEKQVTVKLPTAGRGVLSDREYDRELVLAGYDCEMICADSQ